MTLRQLLEQTHEELGWYGIVEHLIKLYPNQHDNADGYLTALAELLITQPSESDGFTLVVEMVDGKDLLPGEEPYAHVFGKNGQSNLESDPGLAEYAAKNPGNEEWLAKEASWAMEFTPWDQLLAMDVETDLPLQDAFVHILWEMTFFGFSSNDVQYENERIQGRYEEMRRSNGKTT